jgi:hypothetical protein
MIKANIIIDLDPTWAGRGFDMNGEDITIPPSVCIPEEAYPPFFAIQNGNRVVQIFDTFEAMENRLLIMQRIAELNANVCSVLPINALNCSNISELIAL